MYPNFLVLKFFRTQNFLDPKFLELNLYNLFFLITFFYPIFFLLPKFFNSSLDVLVNLLLIKKNSVFSFTKVIYWRRKFRIIKNNTVGWGRQWPRDGILREHARGRNLADCGRICESPRKSVSSIEEMFQMINNVDCHSLKVNIILWGKSLTKYIEQC